MPEPATSAATRFLVRSRAAGPVDRDQEVVLVLTARGASSAEQRRALDRLVLLNLRHVVGIALRYLAYGVLLDDLISEGCVGLVHAIEKFDPSRGTRFVTYAAPWVRAMILQHVRKTWRLVSTEAGPLRSRNFFRLRRERAAIAAVCSDPEEVSRLLDERMGAGSADAARQLDERDASIDQPDENGRPIVDRLLARQEPVDELLDLERGRAELRGLVGQALASLDRRERRIVTARLMSDPDDAPSLAELGTEMGVSRERVRQLEVRALAKLKKILPAYGGIASRSSRDKPLTPGRQR